MCPNDLQKRVFISTRSFCWWCHCKSHWISMAHDNYRDCGHPLRSPVLFPSKSTCQRGENGKHNTASFFWVWLYFSETNDNLFLHLCLQFPQKGTSPVYSTLMHRLWNELPLPFMSKMYKEKLFISYMLQSHKFDYHKTGCSRH